MNIQNKRLVGIVISVAFILLIPFIAMQFSEDVNWTLSDFVIALALLLGAGLTCDFVLRKVNKKETRIALCIGVVVLLLLIWAELAVGIFGTPLAGS